VVEGCGQPLRIVEDALVQVARVGVEHGRLAADRFDHPGMTVPDMGDVVVGVEIAPSPGIPEPDALAPHDMDGIVVEGGHVRPQQLRATRDEVGHRSPGSGVIAPEPVADPAAFVESGPDAQAAERARDAQSRDSTSARVRRLTGLTRWKSKPAARVRRLSSSLPHPVRATRIVDAARGLTRNAEATSWPSMPGIPMSQKTMPGANSAAMRRASIPL